MQDPRSALPPTSLILCSRNRPNLLQQAIEAILAGDEVPTEIIVIDDSDFRHGMLETLCTTRETEMRYCWTHSRGLSRANNEGIALAHCDIVVFTQDDVVVTKTWLGNIVRSLPAMSQRTVVTGRVQPTEAEVAGGFALSNKTEARHMVYQGHVNEDVLYFQNMAMYRSVWHEIGPFDERLGPGTPFPSSEDADYCLRLLKAGYSIAYIPGAVVCHRMWREKKTYLPLRWAYGVARGGYYAKYISRHDRYGADRLMRDIRIHLVAVPWSLWSDRQKARGDIVLVLGLLFGVLRWKITERKLPSS